MTERQELKEFWKDKDLNKVFSTTSLLYRTCPLTYLTNLFEVCKTNIGWDPDTTLKPYPSGARRGWGQQEKIEDQEVKKLTCRLQMLKMGPGQCDRLFGKDCVSAHLTAWAGFIFSF